jgi:hypothetical protein
MSIGSTITYSIPVVGTTVDTLARAKESLFTDPIAVGGVDVPVTLQLRAASLAGIQRRFGAVWKFNPAMLDSASAVTNGRITVSVNIDATRGVVITDTVLANHVRYALSTLLASTLIEGLRDGSLT